MQRVCRSDGVIHAPTGHPSSLRFGHPDVTTDDTACLRGYSKGAVLSSLLQGTRPRFASDTLMSLTDNTAPSTVATRLPLSLSPCRNIEKYS